MIVPFSLFGIARFASELDKTIKKGNYDLILATSEPAWGVFGYYYAKKHRKPFVYDLHDNYEVYATYKIPFYKYIDNYIIKNADFITTVSYALRDKISSVRRKNIHVIQNGVNTKLFRPVPKIFARKKLGLPTNKKIIAYAGSLQRDQGVHILVKAFKLLQKRHADIMLFLAGTLSKDKKPIDIDHSGIVNKNLDQEGVNLVINAADVVVLPNQANEFTKYCFHYKLAEYMACETPIAATRVGDVGRMLEGTRHELCEPGNAEELAKKIELSFGKGKIRGSRDKIMKNNTWDEIAKKLDLAIKQELKK